MSRYDQLQQLQSLRDQGALTAEEFEREKQRLLMEDNPGNAGMPPPPPPHTPYSRPAQHTGTSLELPWGMEIKTYCMAMHLSQFLGYASFGLGFAAPIIMWAVHKDKFPAIDEHGRMVLNWMISGLIYTAVCIVLSFVLVGIPMLFILGALGIIFPIIGAIKANEGVLWPYPLTIRFF